MEIYYNSWRTAYKNPFGAVKQETEVQFSIQVFSEQVEEVYLVIEKEGSSEGKQWLKLEEQDTHFYTGSYSVSQGKGLYFYYFAINYKESEENKQVYYGALNGKGGQGNYCFQEAELIRYQLTCYIEEDFAPDWYQKAVVYQIFPDRFYNGNEHLLVNQPKPNSFLYGQLQDQPMYIKDETGEIVRWDFYGGNLLGIEKKIPYLKKLGVNAIYLNPIFEAKSNHRYDTADFLKVDSMLGTEEDFLRLIKKLHENDMHLILDGVFNHVGKNSVYFNYDASYGEKLGAFQNPESPYFSWFKFTDYPNEYKSWWGIKDLPEINKEEPSYQQFIFGEKDSVLAKWAAFHVDGWRLDVADELSDTFIEGIRKRLNTYENQVLLGEVWEDASNKIAYDKRRQYILGNGLHGVMNYPLKELIFDFLLQKSTAKEFSERFTTLKENYPKAVFYNNLNNLGTHDTERLLTRMNEDRKKAQTAFALLSVLPGVPCLYYGDEAGLTGGKDPDNRKFFPWGQENQAYRLEFEQWIHARREQELLQTGDCMTFFNNDLLGICRFSKDEFALFVVNPTDEPKQIDVDQLMFTQDCPQSTHLFYELLNGQIVPAKSYLWKK